MRTRTHHRHPYGYCARRPSIRLLEVAFGYVRARNLLLFSKNSLRQHKRDWSGLALSTVSSVHQNHAIMSNPFPSVRPAQPVVTIPIDTAPAPAAFWDRARDWIVENKAVVYTIAGVGIVVTGAGVAYYLSPVCESRGLYSALYIFLFDHLYLDTHTCTEEHKSQQEG